MDGMGRAIIRMQTDDASYGDIRKIIKSILESEDFRSRASSVSMLVSDTTQSKREEYARALAIILLSDFEPSDSASSTHMTIATPFFVRHCTPPPHGAWESSGHLVSTRNKKGKADTVRVSAYLRDILMALEDLWGVPGHLVTSGATTAPRV